MAQETATTALVYDARGAVAGAKEFEAASEKVKAANKNAAAASDTLTSASDRLQKAQDAVSKAAERVQKAQETAARAAERFGLQSEQAAQAAERVARATETVSRAQDRLSRAQEAAVTATERVAIGLGNQERRLASIEAKYAPAIAAENRLAQTKAYLNGVIERGGPQMERAQRLLEALTEQERKAAQASQQAAQAMAAGTAATVRAAQAQDMAATSTKRLNGFVQQAGYQVSDAANQIATGTNAFTVFGMQAGQLLGTLGPVGAAIGAVVNVAGVAAGVIQKQAEAAAEAAQATDLLTAATRAGLEITESGVDKARRLRDERNEQAGASYRAAIAERELADAIAISAALSARAAMEQTKASNERYLAQGPGRFLGPAELSRIEYEQKVYEGTTKTATETAKRLDEAQQAYEKFRSSLNKTGGFSGEEVDKLRERVDGIVSSYDDATLRTVTLRQKQEELDEAVKAGVITQTQADDILQKYTKHLDENSAAAKEAEKAAKAREKAEEKLEKQILAAVKAADAKAVEEYNKVMGEGKRVYESTRTPAEKYADELANLRRLLDYGAINQDTFNRAVQAADPAFQEAQKAAERYAQEVNRVAEDIAKDWSETLYDAIILRDKQTSIVDAFRDLFKRIAIEAIKANIVLPITQQIVGAAPGLFGIQAPGSSSAANQNGGIGGMGGAGNLLSLGSRFMPSSWTGGIGNSIATGLNQVGYSMGIGGTAFTSGALSGSITGMGAAGMGSAAGGAASAAGVAAVPGGLTNAAVSGAGSGLAPAMAGGASLMSYLGPAAAGLAAGGLIGPLVANGNKAVGGLAGAASGAAAGALIGSVIPGIGTLVGALIGGAGGGLGGLIGTQKPSVGPNSRATLDFTDGAFRTGASAADNGGNEGAVRTLADQISAALNSVLAAAGLKSSADLKTIGAVDIMEKDGRYITEVSGQKKEYKDQSAAASALMNDLLQKFIQDGATDFVKKDSPQIASNLRKALDASIGKPAEELVANMQLAATDFSKVFDEAGKAQADQLAGAIAQVTVSFTTMRDRSQQLGLAVDGLADSADKATSRLIDAATRQAQGKGYIDSAMTVRATFESVGQSLLAAGQSGDKAVKLYGAQMSALVNSLGTGTDALKALSDMAESLSGVDDTAALFARTRTEQVRAAVQEDLTLRQMQAQVQLGQVSQDAYDLAVLEVQQKRELATVTDTAVRAQLEQVQATERAAAAAKTAAEAQRAFASASGTTRSYLLSLVTGEAGGLSAPDRYRNAQNEYATASAAIGPQATAEQLARQTEAAKALLDASRAMNGSTTEYFRDLANVSTDLAKSAQITPDDPVVTAINALKASVDGLGGKVDVQVSVDAINFVRGEIEQTIRTHVSTAGLSLREIQLANGVLDAVDQSVTVALSPATGLTARELQLYQGALSNIDQSITAAVDTSALTGANREIALGQLSDATRTINTALGVFPTMTAEQREFVLGASRDFARTVNGTLGTMPNLSAEQQAILLGQTDSFGRTFNALAGATPSLSAEQSEILAGVSGGFTRTFSAAVSAMPVLSQEQRAVLLGQTDSFSRIFNAVAGAVPQLSSEQAAILSGTSDSFTRAFNSAVGALPALSAEQRAVLLGQNGAFTTTFQGVVAGMPSMSVEQQAILLGQSDGFSRTFSGLVGALPGMSQEQRSILLGVSDSFTRVYQQAVGVLPGMSAEQRAILTGYTNSFTRTFQSAAAAMPSMSADQLSILRGQTDDFTRTFIAATNDLTLTADEKAVLQAKSEQISRTITQSVATTETVSISRSIDDKLSSILAEIKAQMVAANTNLGTVNKSVVALASPNNPITVTSLFKGGAGMSFETGGVIPGGVVGNGIWGKDSVMARYAGGGTVNLAGGEGILTAPATTAIGGADMVDFINRTRSLPAASMRPLVMPVVASPRHAASSDAGMAAELKAIREEVAALRRDNNKLIQGQALMEVEAVDRQTSELKLVLASKTKHAASAA